MWGINKAKRNTAFFFEVYFLLIKTFEESVRLEQDNQGLKKLETFRKNILPLF
jgi:hypothetical protein